MAKNIRRIARGMGADLVAKVSDAGGGAFGAARLAAELRERLVPAPGIRTGRPTHLGWDQRPKVPMSSKTLKRLEQLAEECSTPKRRVSPMQVAAQLLEQSVAQVTSH